MKTTLSFFSLILLSLQLTAQQNTANSEIIQRIESWKDAYNNNDIKTLSSFYTDDAYYVSPHVPNLLIHGLDKLTENFRKGISQGGHIDSVIVLTSDISCDLAYMVCKYVATNNGVTVNGRNIIIMKKSDSKWLITTHASLIKD